MKSPQHHFTKEKLFMYSLSALRLESNSKIKINFDGGDLSSDAGLLLLKEFICKIGPNKLIEQHFQTNNKAIRITKIAKTYFRKYISSWQATSLMMIPMS
jgi:hypothetical protein